MLLNMRLYSLNDGGIVSHCLLLWKFRSRKKFPCKSSDLLENAGVYKFAQVLCPSLSIKKTLVFISKNYVIHFQYLLKHLKIRLFTDHIFMDFQTGKSQNAVCNSGVKVVLAQNCPKNVILSIFTILGQCFYRTESF